MIIEKINQDFIRKSFSVKKTVTDYIKATEEIGLWKSERLMMEKYFDPESRILDIGCGTGRTTIGLYGLGYHSIEGLDLSEAMIEEAKRITKDLNCPILYHVGNAVCLDYNNETFDNALFSFNGLMQIPGKENRIKALKEINRVLKSGGYFFFTTHDRDNIEYKLFWEVEKKKWEFHLQDKRLHEFGDKIINMAQRDTFLHIPTREEVISCLKKTNFQLIEEKLRSQLCEESAKVKEISTDCLLWLVQKP